MSGRIIKTTIEPKIVKSYQNTVIEASQIKKFMRGMSEPHKIVGNTSAVLSVVLDDKRPGLPFVEIMCSDTIGGLSHYILSCDDGMLSIFVENLTAVDRLIRINYSVYYE
jgi:hypothetical protein